MPFQIRFNRKKSAANDGWSSNHQIYKYIIQRIIQFKGRPLALPLQLHFPA